MCSWICHLDICCCQCCGSGIIYSGSGSSSEDPQHWLLRWCRCQTILVVGLFFSFRFYENGNCDILLGIYLFYYLLFYYKNNGVASHDLDPPWAAPRQFARSGKVSSSWSGYNAKTRTILFCFTVHNRESGSASFRIWGSFWSGFAAKGKMTQRERMAKIIKDFKGGH